MYHFILTGIPIRLYAEIRFNSQIKISYLLHVYACRCTSSQAKGFYYPLCFSTNWIVNPLLAKMSVVEMMSLYWYDLFVIIVNPFTEYN